MWVLRLRAASSHPVVVFVAAVTAIAAPAVCAARALATDVVTASVVRVVAVVEIEEQLRLRGSTRGRREGRPELPVRTLPSCPLSLRCVGSGKTTEETPEILELNRKTELRTIRIAAPHIRYLFSTRMGQHKLARGVFLHREDIALGMVFRARVVSPSSGVALVNEAGMHKRSLGDFADRQQNLKPLSSGETWDGTHDHNDHVANCRTTIHNHHT